MNTSKMDENFERFKPLFLIVANPIHVLTDDEFLRAYDSIIIIFDTLFSAPNPRDWPTFIDV